MTSNKIQGYEINPDFIPMIVERLGENDLYDRPEINVTRQRDAVDLAKETAELPYQFVDVHKIDKRIDVKKLQFGSKIDSKSTTKREDLFSVKEVVSPELISLSNGLTVRLIGVKTNPSLNGSATEYLTSKLKGKKVFLRYDETKYDDENRLLVYMYLENKTFVNAHLLKDKMALLDDSINFKYKEKFQRL